MKAVVWTGYGSPDVLQLANVEKPVPKDGEILVKTHAATVNAGDCELRNLTLAFWIRLPVRLYAGFVRPKRLTILGQELSGVVEAVGPGVTEIDVGDRVFAATGFTCGAHAEFACLKADAIVSPMPAHMSFGEAATMPIGGLNALNFLKKAGLKNGQRILINGAGGSIGTIAVQLAKLSGAHVTCVDSADKLEMLRRIGADRVLDYSKDDFTKGGEVYDVVFDIVGKSPFRRSMRTLEPDGIYMIANPSITTMIRGLVRSMTGKRRVIVGVADESVEDLNYLRDLVEKGKIQAVIDKRFDLSHVADAHRYVESGRKKGNVVIDVVSGTAQEDAH